MWNIRFSVFLLFYFLSEGNGSLEAGDTTRYLIYSVNPGEGFNLRRDVHMRAASLVQQLRRETKENWVLVLPPWPRLYHWKTNGIKQTNVKWEVFFDLPSLNEYVPTIEFDDYITQEGEKIDEVIWLQNFASFDKWEEKLETAPCNDQVPYAKTSSGEWKGTVFGVKDIAVEQFRCVSVLGLVNSLIPEVLGKKSVLVEHFEVVLHTNFGGREYWLSRGSMVYAKHLRDAGNKFMRSSLGYDPGTNNGRQRRENVGGDYLAVHLRREDYKRARPGDIPSLEGAATQINNLKSLQGLSKVFLATDAPLQERKKLAKLVKGVVWYTPSQTELNRFGDGGVAIIDQWISSHAKFFVGSIESTFSFRIREDRQFMGFSKESTYNQLCGKKHNENDHTSCPPPTYWEVPENVLAILESRAEHKETREGRTEL